MHFIKIVNVFETLETRNNRNYKIQSLKLHIRYEMLYLINFKSLVY